MKAKVKANINIEIVIEIEIKIDNCSLLCKKKHSYGMVGYTGNRIHTQFFLLSYRG